jgi:hypothetical protein
MIDSHPTLEIHPTSVFKSSTPSLPIAISAFDKFNRDIIDHKISPDSIKRLKPKSSLHPSKRIQSARRKPISSKKPSSRTRLTSAKYSSQPIFQKDGIINVNIPVFNK